MIYYASILLYVFLICLDKSFTSYVWLCEMNALIKILFQWMTNMESITCEYLKGNPH